MFKLNCSKCGQVFKVQEKYAGKRGKCPKCGTIISIPELKHKQQEAVGGSKISPKPQATRRPVKKPSDEVFQGPLRLSGWCRGIVAFDSFWLVFLGIAVFLRAMQGIFFRELGGLRWFGIFLTFVMITFKFPADRKILKHKFEMLRFAWIGLALWVPLAVVRAINAHGHTSEWAHPDSMVATNRFLADIVITGFPLLYNLVYLLALLRIQSISKKISKSGIAQSCPSCGSSLQIRQVICVRCGLNLRTGKKLDTQLISAELPEEEKQSVSDDSAESERDGDEDNLSDPGSERISETAYKTKEFSKTCILLPIIGVMLYMFGLKTVGGGLIFLCTPLLIIFTSIWGMIGRAKGLKEGFLWAMLSAGGAFVLILIFLLFGVRPPRLLFSPQMIFVGIFGGPFIAGFLLLVVYLIYPKITIDKSGDVKRPKSLLFISLGMFVLWGVLIPISVKLMNSNSGKNKTVSKEASTASVTEKAKDEVSVGRRSEKKVMVRRSSDKYEKKSILKP